MNRLAGKKVLVTGATGFIGGRLVEKLLLEEGAEVRVLVRNFGSAVWLSRLDVAMMSGDITEPATLVEAVAGCNVVVHCAAALGGEADVMARVNVTGTANLLAAAEAAGVARFVHVSTLAVHGQDIPDGTNETTPYRPVTEYGRTKLQADQLVEASCPRYGYHSTNDCLWAAFVLVDSRSGGADSKGADSDYWCGRGGSECRLCG